MKIVDGLLQADDGEILWHGEAQIIDGPKAARAWHRHGLSTFHCLKR